MRKGKGKHKHTPSPSELLGRNPPAEEETGEVIETPEPQEPTGAEAEIQSLEDLVAKSEKLSSEVREKLMEQLRKLRAQEARSTVAKAMASFDADLKNEETGLPKFLGDLAAKHGVDLSSRKITITYPEGKFNHTNVPKGSKGSGKGNGNRQGFPPSWGGAELIGKGGKVEKKATSPSKLAEAMNLQVEGMRNMLDVFESPKERGTKNDLPKTYRVEAERGSYFRVITI